MAQWRKAYCPMCGLLHGRRVQRDDKGQVVSDESFWGKTAHYHGQKPFGAIFQSEGRGTLQVIGYYDRDEDEEGYFSLIKNRLLAVIGEWIEKDWIQVSEIEKIIEKYK